MNEERIEKNKLKLFDSLRKLNNMTSEEKLKEFRDYLDKSLKVICR
jgi:hypothetical protein